MLKRKILEVHQSDRTVQRALVNRQAGQPAVAKHLDQTIFGNIQRHRHDIGLWHGHIFQPHPAQVHHARRACQKGIALTGRAVQLFKFRTGRWRQNIYNAAPKTAVITCLIRLRALRRPRGTVYSVAHFTFLSVSKSHPFNSIWVCNAHFCK